ncbi:hypothetical protein PsYK624_086800 [Phanerochaete sordida]|uniref:Uncharacterized protein n=1 Tax=Phanerochaete sordida TaxID=48140 RepID=A0A9P3GCT1_9APHY|nr:hypothetical protein PsYK624_086800 [Phanerochaete sordida]
MAASLALALDKNKQSHWQARRNDYIPSRPMRSQTSGGDLLPPAHAVEWSHGRAWGSSPIHSRGWHMHFHHLPLPSTYFYLTKATHTARSP